MTPRESQLATICFALTRCRAHFRAMAQTHNTDEAGGAVAEIIVEQIERSNFAISDGEIRQKPPSRDGGRILRGAPAHRPPRSGDAGS
jgi:hypothetical protein